MAGRLRHFGAAAFTNQTFLLALFPIVGLMLNAPSVADAQVPTDITSSGLNTQIDQNAQNSNLYDITGGTRPGGGPNLFHSFGRFDIGQTAGVNDIANFLNETRSLTTNIIGRITDSSLPSQIYGTIQIDPSFGSANLFLMNPSGFVFGPNALLNVGGAVSFTTAQYIRLFDGLARSANFYADPTRAESILTIAPSAFEFSSATPAAYGFGVVPDPNATITVQGSNLSVSSGQSISLVGGEVIIEGGAQLTAPSGKILLASAASPGEFDIDSLASLPNTEETSFTAMGTVSLSQSAVLNVSGQLDETGAPIGTGASGTVYIRSGQLVMDAATIQANTVGVVDGASTAVNLDVAQGATLSNGAVIYTQTSGTGQGGDVQITAGGLTLDGASVQSVTTGDGNGGNISITNTHSLNLMNGAQIVSSTSGAGNGGNISVATTNTPDDAVTISGYDSTGNLVGFMNPFLGLITSGVYSTASAGGNGGHLTITAPNVTLDDGATLATLNTGSGIGGNISINSNTVNAGLTNTAFLLSFTGFDPTTGPIDSGNGGTITIRGLSGAPDSTATAITVSNGSSIYSITGGPTSGDGGDIVITSKEVTLDTGASINSGFSGIGDGGNITLNVGTLSILNSAAINSSNDLATPGPGGNITVQGLPVPEVLNNVATLVTLSNFGNITSSSNAPDPGGNIVLTSKEVNLNTGASISSNSGGGNSGNITMSVDTLTLDGDGTEITSKISSSGFSQGGNITVQGLPVPEVLNNAAASVTLSNGGRISTESFEAGDGGDLAITAKSLRMDNAIISSLTHNTGQGGDIILGVGDAVLLGGAAIRSITDSAGGGGSVTVQGLNKDNPMAESLTISGQSGLLSNSLGSGRLGNIEVHAKTLTLTDIGVIQAGTQQDTGLTAGDVILDANLVNMFRGSSILSQVFSADAGKVSVTAARLTMDDSRIETSTHGIGHAGDVVLNVRNISLADGSAISSNSLGTDPGAGNAGSITIQGLDSPVNLLTITDSSISTSAAGTGQGGRITVDTTNLALNNATLSASVNDFDPLDSNDGPAVGTGNITFAARHLTMKDSDVTADSLGTRNAGNVLINSKAAPGTRFLMENSTISTSASQADGGNIQIYFTDMIRLTDSIITSSVGNPVKKETEGGNITIDPDFFILQGSQVRANAFAGTGGAIDITAGLFLADAFSQQNISASSTFGVSGTVQINAPINNLSSVVGRLPESLVEVQALLRAACAARMAQGQASSFVERGRDSIPTGPEGLLASPYIPVASSRVARTQAPPSMSLFGLQLRRMPVHEPPAPVMILSENTACSS